jgi:hypothetical protein
MINRNLIILSVLLEQRGGERKLGRVRGETEKEHSTLICKVRKHVSKVAKFKIITRLTEQKYDFKIKLHVFFSLFHTADTLSDYST